MNTNESACAWKDPEYQEQLTDAQRAQLAEVAGGGVILPTGVCWLHLLSARSIANTGLGGGPTVIVVQPGQNR